MSETIKAIGEIAGKSIAEEKTRHLVNAAATGTAATVTATGSVTGEIIGWLPTIGVFCGMCVSMALFYKTYLEIKLAKIEIAVKSRRKTDKIE